MSGSELSVECELRNRKNQAAYLLADNRPTKSRKSDILCPFTHHSGTNLNTKLFLVI